MSLISLLLASMLPGSHLLYNNTVPRLAQEHGFDAVNLDVEYALTHGPEKVVDLMARHGLQPAAFRFPVKLTDEADFIGEGSNL